MKSFDIAIEEIGNSEKNLKKSDVSFENLKYLYIQDENLYENKYFELAEQFFKILKLIHTDNYFIQFNYNNYVVQELTHRLFWMIKDEEIRNKLKKKFVVIINFYII